MDEGGQVLHEPAGLVHQRRQREVDGLDHDQQDDSVHGQDGDGPREADSAQPFDRRIEQVDEQQPDDERA